MAQENLEIVRRLFTAFSDGDVPALLQELDPDVFLQVDQAGQGVYRGHEGAIKSLADWTEDFDDFKVDAEEFRENGDRVVVRTRHTGRGKASGAPMEGLAWFICQVSDGKVVRVHVLTGERAAFEAAGLSEQAMAQENVEIVRRLFGALNRGALDELAALTPPDFELDRGASRSPDRRVYRGRENVQRLWSDLLDVWSDFEFYEKEMIAFGDAVIRVGGIRGRGRTSGANVAAEGATLWRFRNGRPVSAALFQSKAEALEAAGLSE